MVSIMNRLGGFAEHGILSLHGGVDAAERLADNVSSTIVPAPAGWGNLSFPLTLGRRIRRFAPDLLLTYNWGAIDGVIAAILYGLAPVIHNECGFGADEAVRLKRRRVLVRRWALRRIFRTVVVSEHGNRLALREFRLPPDKVKLIKTGVDIERFRPGNNLAWRKDHGIPEGTLLFGFLGGFRPEKNLGLMIRAFAEAGVPSARLVLFGSGGEQSKLERLVRDTGIGDRVLFAGPISDAPAAYSALDVFLLSSLTEQTPNVLLEAMASGLPVITTDVGDCADRAGPHQASFIVPANDVTAYAGAIRKLATKEEIRRSLGRRNRERAEEHFSIDEMVRQYKDLYQSAARSRAASSLRSGGTSTN